MSQQDLSIEPQSLSAIVHDLLEASDTRVRKVLGEVPRDHVALIHWEDFVQDLESPQGSILLLRALAALPAASLESEAPHLCRVLASLQGGLQANLPRWKGEEQTLFPNHLHRPMLRLYEDSSYWSRIEVAKERVAHLWKVRPQFRTWFKKRWEELMGPVSTNVLTRYKVKKEGWTAHLLEFHPPSRLSTLERTAPITGPASLIACDQEALLEAVLNLEFTGTHEEKNYLSIDLEALIESFRRSGEVWRGLVSSSDLDADPSAELLRRLEERLQKVSDGLKNSRANSTTEETLPQLCGKKYYLTYAASFRKALIQQPKTSEIPPRKKLAAEDRREYHYSAYPLYVPEAFRDAVSLETWKLLYRDHKVYLEAGTFLSTESFERMSDLGFVVRIDNTKYAQIHAFISHYEGHPIRPWLEQQVASVSTKEAFQEFAQAARVLERYRRGEVNRIRYGFSPQEDELLLEKWRRYMPDVEFDRIAEAMPWHPSVRIQLRGKLLHRLKHLGLTLDSLDAAKANLGSTDYAPVLVAAKPFPLHAMPVTKEVHELLTTGRLARKPKEST